MGKTFLLVVNSKIYNQLSRCFKLLRFLLSILIRFFLMIINYAMGSYFICSRLIDEALTKGVKVAVCSTSNELAVRIVKYPLFLTLSSMVFMMLFVGLPKM